MFSFDFLTIQHDISNIVKSVAAKRWERLYRQNPKAIAVYIQRVDLQLKEQATLINWENQIIDQLKADLDRANGK
ncbi:MAG: hypothetical protein KME11_05225 [Timaviella obliquedivisa GSE-PSE-MK23-08B]|jgi:hypothetical protein|nr:hypothetical protein [Timaviella obliquedivisa GSE-PSE-MK23-08B]